MYQNLMQEFFKIEWDGEAPVLITMVYVMNGELYIQVTCQETGDTDEIPASELPSRIIED